MSDSSTPTLISPHLYYPNGGVGRKSGEFIEDKSRGEAEEMQKRGEGSVAMLNSRLEDEAGDVGCMGDEECGCSGVWDGEEEASQEVKEDDAQEDGEHDCGRDSEEKKSKRVCERRNRKLCATQSGYSWTRLARHHQHHHHEQQQQNNLRFVQKWRAGRGRESLLVTVSPEAASSSLEGWFSWIDNITPNINLNFKFKLNIIPPWTFSSPWFYKSGYTTLYASPSPEIFNLKPKSKLWSAYHPQPTFISSHTYPRPLSSPRRILSTLLWALLAAPVVLLVCVLLYGGVPPGYGDVRRAERAWIDFHAGAGRLGGAGGGAGVEGEEEGRGYLRFKDHIWGHGFNNVLQEVLFTSYLAHTLNRTYVFEDYIWSRLPLPYTIYDFTLRPTRVPMGAFLSGALVGEDVVVSGYPRSALSSSSGSGHILSSSSPECNMANPTHSNSTTREKLAIPAEYFENVCRPEDTFVLEYDFPSPASSPSPLNVDCDSGTAMSSGRAVDDEEYDLRGPREGLDGVDIFKWWAWRVRQEDMRDRKCVEVRERKRRVFDAFFFGSTRLLPLYPGLRESPVLKGFKWSGIIRGAADKIVRRMVEGGHGGTSTSDSSSPCSSKRHPYLPSSPTPSARTPSLPNPSPAPSSTTTTNTTTQLSLPPTPIPIPGLVALHLRRGDYKRHCARLAGWESRYMGFNRFEGLVDRFEPWGEDEAEQKRDQEHSDEEPNSDPKKERMAHYIKHCLPSIPQIVKRLGQVREDHVPGLSNGNVTDTTPLPHTLNQVYILTNAWPSYISSLRLALQHEGWGNVWSTADFEGELDRRERGVAVGVDMALAVEKAEVFVGNGFSSMSANVVMLRLAGGFDVSTNRFL
ncbi:hypothetical protein BJ165DRAFT_1509905 [Panaeolus papilionaceus]|nr:hypothetical protein BJ165DRAFT_1509905 [Panaeolus papilionaceus]